MFNKKTGRQIISLENAAALIKSGDTIWVGSGLSISTPFLDKLADRHKELQNVTIIGETFLSYTKLLTDPKYTRTFRIISLYESLPLPCPSFATNKIEYVLKPDGPYAETIFRAFKINIMVIEVCPPKNNYCNLGATGGATSPYFSKCKGIKIAVINDLQQPYYADEENNSIPLDEFDCLCISNHQTYQNRDVT
ncbi:MAG: CoA transferase [Oscillospiraceae bacterium]|nr:CoA transferase [Oscillospiraceae bacterium]